MKQIKFTELEKGKEYYALQEAIPNHHSLSKVKFLRYFCGNTGYYALFICDYKHLRPSVFVVHQDEKEVKILVLEKGEL
jgi:hypothetical protein